MKSNLKSAATIFGICLVGVSLLYLAFVFKPLYDKTQILNDQHSVNQAQIKEYDTYIRESAKIESDIEIIDKKIETLNLKQPLTGQQIANDINTGFMECNVLLKSISMTDETVAQPETVSSTGDVLYSVTSSLSFEGNEEQIMAILNYFEKTSKGAYYITNLSVSAGTEKASGVSLMLTAYYYAPPKETTPLASSEDVTDQELDAASAAFS